MNNYLGLIALLCAATHVAYGQLVASVGGEPHFEQDVIGGTLCYNVHDRNQNFLLLKDPAKGYSVSMHIGANGFMTRVGLSYQDQNQGLQQLTVDLQGVRLGNQFIGWTEDVSSSNKKVVGDISFYNIPPCIIINVSDFLLLIVTRPRSHSRYLNIFRLQSDVPLSASATGIMAYMQDNATLDPVNNEVEVRLPNGNIETFAVDNRYNCLRMDPRVLAYIRFSPVPEHHELTSLFG